MINVFLKLVKNILHIFIGSGEFRSIKNGVPTFLISLPNRNYLETIFSMENEKW